MPPPTMMIRLVRAVAVGSAETVPASSKLPAVRNASRRVMAGFMGNPVTSEMEERDPRIVYRRRVHDKL